MTSGEAFAALLLSKQIPYSFPLGQGFSTLLTLWPFNTVHVVVTLAPHHKIISSILHNSIFATFMNHNESDMRPL